ncbi:hypothetical protein ACFQU9_39650 [Actinomadura namibiensis]|uniref:Uncharacterized protein n=1 Tax=Actinomadura namibiensis TaxID=182080 RepID=A0A7W3QKE7_ACTNM|nr:hypothetical protein [Actinomadura namibiensis]MBA8950322.1 hypothetical protein [Actinomadura namibiensis]
MAQRGAKTGTLWALVLAIVLVPLAALAGAGDARAAAGNAPGPGRVVIVGVPGLKWSDVTERGAPTLWRLTGQGAVGGLSVRTPLAYTCPTDGWLTLSAGQRSRLAHGDCALPAAPQVTPDGGAVAPGWETIGRDNADGSYHARIGLLGQSAADARQCAFAVGPGAVFGLADANGRVARYAESPDRVAPADWARCPLTAVDVDDVFRAYVKAGTDAKGRPVPVSDRERAAAVAAADRRVGQVVAALPAGTTLLVAGLSDTTARSHLRVALATGPGFPSGFLTSTATRQPGLVTLTDLTVTAMRVTGLARPDGAVGSPWTPEPTRGSASYKREALVDEDVAAQVIRRAQGSYFWVLGAAQIAVYLVAALLLRRRPEPGTRRRVLGVARVVALLAGATPVASFLAGLVPWWQAPRPTPVLVVSVLAFGALVAGIALAGPWRRSVLGPGLVVAGVTAVVLAADVMLGSTLQLNSLMGYTGVVAGRFYGFGNQAFSLFATASVLTAAWLAARPLRAGRTMAAAGVVAAVGVVAVAVDGLPMWGSDFGGVLAMVPVFALVGLMVAGRRVSWWKLGLFCLAGAVVVLFISFLNARSAHPTHLGRFWQQLESGDAWGVVVRKFHAMVGALGLLPVAAVLALVVVAVYLVLADPARRRAGWLARLYAAAPTTRPALLGALTIGVIGTLVNDSGLVILSVAFCLAAPLTLAALLRTLEERPGDVPPDTSAPGTPAPRSAARER